MVTLTQTFFQGVLSVLAFICFFTSPSLVFSETPQHKDLFTEVDLKNIKLSANQENILNTLQQDDATLDLRVVKVNTALLVNESSINMNLFSNKNLVTLKEKIELSNTNIFTWYGSIPGKLGATILSVWQDAVVGFVSADHESYNLQSLGDGLHVIIKVDPDKYAPCGNSNSFQKLQFRAPLGQGIRDISQFNARKAFSKNESFNSPKGNINALNRVNTITTIKVFVAYTTAAKNGAGGTNGINALIDNAIAAANQSYVNSGNIQMTLQAAYKVEVSYTESSALGSPFLTECGPPPIQRHLALEHFQNPTDGYMDEIHDLRGLYGGDVAALITASDAVVGTCGEAFEIGITASEAFCIVAYNCAAAANKWSFAHEIGHLHGARHDDDNCNIPYTYGHGYTPTGQNWTTMMGVKPGKIRIQYWSNPNVLYQGVPTGNATTAHNARVLTETAGTVADFVQELSGTISTNTTLTGMVSLAANVMVTNNATLTISSTAQIFLRDGVSLTINNGSTLIVNLGAKLKFGSGASLIVNGKITADSNNPNQRITFAGAAPVAPGKWNGITINSGSTANVSTLRRCDVQYATDGIKIIYTGNSNNVTIDKCRISNNSLSGIYVNGNAYSGASVHPTISNNHIHSNGYFAGVYLCNYAKPLVTGNRIETNYWNGIYATGSASATVEFNYVTGTAYGSGYGMQFEYSSHAQVHRNTVTMNNAGSGGIYAVSSSHLVAYGSGSNKGRNKITVNSGDGIFALASTPIFGKDVTGEWGNNQIQDNTGYQAKQSSGNQLKAERCYWAGQHTDISGDVDNVPYLTTPPDPVGWGQSDGYDPSFLMPANPDMNTDDTDQIVSLSKTTVTPNTFDPIAWSAKFASAMQAGLQMGDWAEAAEVITELWRELQDGRVPNVDYTLLTNYADSSVVELSIRKYLALALVEKSLAGRDVSTALADLAKHRQGNPTYAAEFLANTGIILLFRQNDLAAAQNVLAQLQAMAQSRDAIAAEHVKLFGRIIEAYQQRQSGMPAATQKPIAAIPTSELLLPTTSVLRQNYPNPFNPETTIRFHLNDRQKVRLVIFDLTGQHVRTLVEGELPAGEQTISWDGRDHQGRLVASGVYFYELTMNNKIERKKMTLVR